MTTGLQTYLLRPTLCYILIRVETAQLAGHPFLYEPNQATSGTCVPVWHEEWHTATIRLVHARHILCWLDQVHITLLNCVSSDAITDAK